MRYAVPELATPHPLARRLPAVYAGDDLIERMLAGFDEVMAPIHASMDNFRAYLDPALTPPDFLDWLGGWVAAQTATGQPEAQRREAVARAIERHRRRGTAAGLAEEIHAEFGVRPEIEESGGTEWSPTANHAVTGDARPWLTVRVRVADPAAFPAARLRATVEGVRPAHVPVTVEVLPR